MDGIKLDQKKLLGFKIIAMGDTAVTLHSPKIGAKGCVPTVTAEVPAMGAANTGKEI